MSSDNNNNSSNGLNNNINQLSQLSPFRVTSEVSPELADIIEIDRNLYSHWALYVGDGQVVDVVGADDNELPDAEHAVVRLASLGDVAGMAGSGAVRVNNKEVPAKERNLSPIDPELVVKAAMDRVGSCVAYNLLTRNCEHYLTQWKYGRPWSDQAAVALTTIRALRRDHKDSTSDGHSFLVNSLNEVLNSPGAIGSTGSSSPALIRANSCQFTSSSSQTETTHVI